MGRWKIACAALLLTSAASVTPAGAASFTPVVTGLNNPFGLAVDGSGNLFIADAGAGVIYEAFAPGYQTKVVLAAGAPNTPVAPEGVAVDKNGNVFVADDGDGTVKEILAPGYTSVIVLASGGLGLMRSIAVDANENLFVTDLSGNRVFELPASNYASPVAIGGSINNPFGVALDPAGNVFVTTDNAGGTITEILAAGGYTTTNPLTVNGNHLRGIAIDWRGNLFYGSDTSPIAVFEAPVSGGYASSAVIAGGLGNPNAVAVDKLGNVFIANAHGGTSEIDELIGFDAVPALPPIGLALLGLLLGGMGWRLLGRRAPRAG